MFIVRFFANLVRAIWYGLDTLRRILHLILLVGLFVILLAGSVGEPVSVPSSAALVIDPTGTLVEELEGSPLDRALATMNGQPPPQTLLRDVTDSLDRAVDDGRIKAVYLDLDGLQGGGLAKLQAIAIRLDKMRAAGKKVVAFGGGYTRDQYYLAAHADEVVLHDLGLVYPEGYEYYRTFFRDALEKLRVDVNVFRVGEYKSFVEPYIRDQCKPGMGRQPVVELDQGRFSRPPPGSRGAAGLRRRSSDGARSRRWQCRARGRGRRPRGQADEPPGDR